MGLTKTPEEIKKGIECCSRVGHCYECPYKEECLYLVYENPMHMDTLAYIQQLEERLDDIVKTVNEYYASRGMLIPELCREIDKAKAQVPRWISVKERLPEDGKTVFVVCKDGFTTMMLFRDGNWYWYGITYDSITHWIDLPQPPREE